MATSLKKGMLYVMIANLINLGFNLITNFVLPKELSVENYAMIKTFQLYISYAGLFHFGFVDGMYLKYGGKSVNNIKKDDLNTNLSTLRIFQILVTFICTIVAICLKNPLFICFSLAVMPINLGNYFKQLYQATGEFGLYGKIMNANTILIFIANMMWIFIFRVDSGIYFLVSNVVVYFLIWIVLEINCRRMFKDTRYKIFTFSVKEFINNIRDGILLTVGNLSSVLLTSMDRWFVKALLDTMAFAQYSFAVSMENFMNVAVTPVTITLYNFFCREKNVDRIKKIRNQVMIFAAVIVSSAFPARFILETYLRKYLNSSRVMFLLFASKLFYIIIKSIYVNLYKAQGKQRTYFIKLTLVIVMGFLFNIVCFKIYPAKESFAIGTLLSAIFWYFICFPDFKWLDYKIRELIYPFVQVIAFLVCGFIFNAIIGILLYIVCTVVSSLILLPEETKGMVTMVKDKVSSFR